MAIAASPELNAGQPRDNVLPQRHWLLRRLISCAIWRGASMPVKFSTAPKNIPRLSGLVIGCAAVHPSFPARG